MSHLLHDLYSHQSWADAEHWRTFDAHPAALEDESVRNRVYHIHLTQDAFLCIVRGRRFAGRKLEEFSTMAALKEYARNNHDEAASFLKTLSIEHLATLIVIPWFKDPSLSLSIEQALVQAAMHSHYHRGQNATHMRELGIEPPLIDFIAWIWKGKPAAVW